MKIVWKNLPLDMHPLAPQAHRAAVAAQKQGKFWEFHDLVFANQQQLDIAAYRHHARELGLDMERFERDLVDPDTERIIDADVAEAQSLQVPSTPGFFVNGRFLRGARPFEEFARLINAELERLGLPVPDGARALSAGG